MDAKFLSDLKPGDFVATTEGQFFADKAKAEATAKKHGRKLVPVVLGTTTIGWLVQNP